MKKLSLFRTSANRPASPTSAAPVIHSAPLVRAFVETGDERCPLAGIWSRLPLGDQPADEPHLPQPAMATLFPWRALHSPVIFRPYHVA